MPHLPTTQPVTFVELSAVKAEFDAASPNPSFRCSPKHLWNFLHIFAFLASVEHGELAVFRNLRGRGFDDVLQADGHAGRPTPVVAEALAGIKARRAAWKEADRDKAGVAVSRPTFPNPWGGGNNATFPQVLVGGSAEMSYWVSNGGPGEVLLVGRGLHEGDAAVFAVADEYAGSSVRMPPGSGLAVRLSCRPTALGCLIAVTRFRFRPADAAAAGSAGEFSIDRRAIVRPWDPAFEQLKPTAPYAAAPRRRFTPFNMRHVVPGQRRELPGRAEVSRFANYAFSSDL